MPALNKYNRRDPVTVTLGTSMLYAFTTNVDLNERVALGHNAITGLYSIGSFIGANSPKPRRARRLGPTGWNSSFVAEVPATIAALKAAGWQVSRPPKRRAIVPSTLASARVTTVYVSIGGIKYAWNMPRETFIKITQDVITSLGIQIPTQLETDTLVWGSTIPKPAKAQFIVATGGTGTPIDGQDLLTTFVSPTAEGSLPAGWKIIKPKVLFNQ